MSKRSVAIDWDGEDFISLIEDSAVLNPNPERPHLKVHKKVAAKIVRGHLKPVPRPAAQWKVFLIPTSSNAPSSSDSSLHSGDGNLSDNADVEVTKV